MLKSAALMAVLATPVAADDLMFFQSPSGNIFCMIATGEWAMARCDVMQLTNAVPSQPVDCDLDWGHAFAVELQDMQGARVCAGDTVADPNGMTLGYGDQIDLGGFRCTSEKSGMTCTNPGGHGFTVARARQDLF